MSVIHVSHLKKTFGPTTAVENVSFDVQPGEIFGLLGPNGAGKTTIIRMALDIFKPDSGKVSILGGEMSEDKKKRIGYMPEERGLYQDIPLERCILYLAALKGVPKAEAYDRLQEYLERFDLAAHRKKKVKELSKGMQQKAQIISTVLHQPELLIIDEPFTALDPVNTQMVRELMEELRNAGATVVMSTHQMNQVEELCDRIVLINEGVNILYGNLADIRKRFATGDVLVTTHDPLPAIPGLLGNEARNGKQLLHIDGTTTPQHVLKSLLEHDVRIETFELATPSLNEIFIQVVRAPREENGGGA